MRKGAIQISIGFLIIMVISALVMIFIMGWMGQIFPSLTRIGDYATSSAENEMMKKFTEGTDIVASTIPTRVTFQKGSQVEFIVGVKKTALIDDDIDFFTICVAVSAELDDCTEPESVAVEAEGDDSGITFLMPPAERVERRGVVGRFSVLMDIPTDTDEGFYSYRIFACAKEDSDDACTGLQDDDLAGESDFIVRVE